MTVLDRRSLVAGLTALPATAAAAPRTAGPRFTPLPGDMVLGSPRAKVTVVEYASCACPVCGRWYKEVFAAFKAKHIDTGHARLVYREMLVGGQGEVAIAAAGFLLARAAGPARYFQVVDAIYDSQPGLFDDPQGALVKVAASVGVPRDRFDALIRDEAALKALQDRVDANIKADAVDSTPTFVIDGTKLTPGYHPLPDLDAAIAKARRG